MDCCQTILNSKYFETYNFKILIAQRNDLETNDIDVLITYHDKDILINLVRYQKLLPNQIDIIIMIDDEGNAVLFEDLTKATQFAENECIDGIVV